MNIRSVSVIISLLLFLTVFSVNSQTVNVRQFNSVDYQRQPLFQEQDQIYDRNKSFIQGLELICQQDKVKAEIQGYGTYFTPVDLDDVPPGEYRITLAKTGYYPYNLKITIKSGERSSVQVDLKPFLTQLILKDIPEDSLIYVNNQKIEGNIAEVTPGEVSLRIKAFGYEDFFQVITVDNKEKQVFLPALIRQEFGLTDLKVNRESIWKGDSKSQQFLRFTLCATAQGTGHYQLIREEDGLLIQEKDITIDSAEKNILFNLNAPAFSRSGTYKLLINASNGTVNEKMEKTVEVKEGGKSRWRNSITGSAGFLFCPEATTLPAHTSQIQTGFNPVFTAGSADDFYIPAFLSLRVGITERIEVTAGTALFLSPDVDGSAIDIQGSGKFMILGYSGDDPLALSIALSVNYNGTSGDYGTVPSFDPYAGVTGLSVIIPFQLKKGAFSFTLAPEFRIAPSYPMIEPGGFNEGELYIWNYIRGAVAWDKGIFTAALSASLQSPSYIQGGNQWPFYGGGEVILTPGRTGFSLSVYGGIRYLSKTPLLGTAGLTVGFLW